MSEPTPPPVLRIVRGEPTAEEVAALVAALAASGSAAAAAAAGSAKPLSQWRNRSRSIRPPQSKGPGAWRASGWPR